MSRRARRPSARFRLGAALVVLIAALGVGEGLARLVGPWVPTWQALDTPDVVMVGHPTRLWGMTEGVRQNAGATATINARGLRGALPETPRPRGRERVLITGDSSFFGHGVPDDQTPSEQLRLALHGAGIDSDVVNGAIPGYSTEQTRLLLDEDGWALEPTLLVLANFWSDYNFEPFRDEDLLRTQRAFAGNPLAASALFRLVAAGVDRLRGGAGAHVITWTRHSAWPTTGTRRVPVRRYAENLDTMIRGAQARGIGVALLTPTNRDMARGDLAGADVREPYVEAQRRLAAWHGIPVIDTFPAIRAEAEARGADTLYLDDLHPSAEGNAVIARTILDGLVAAGWPTRRLEGKGEPFDPGGLEDGAPEGGAGSVNPMSPQVNLFPALPDTRTVTPAQGGGTGTADGGSGADAGWTLSGTIDAPVGPVQVEVRTEGGDTVAAIVVQAPGPFVVRVGPGNEAVRVSAQAAAGRAEVSARRGDGPLAVKLGQ